MFTDDTPFFKKRFFVFRKLRRQRSLLTFVLMMIMMVGFGQAAKAQPCTAASVNFCDIEFDEWVRDVPAGLRAALGLDPTDNPVAVPRVARVWPGNGTLVNPPVIVYNGGAGSTAWGNAHGAWALQFEVEWPEAIVVYTQATELTNHDGTWASGGHICWQPRFPHVEEGTRHSDLDYIEQVLDRVDALFNYDHDRMYVAGHSSGGFFTFSLMHFMPDTFRAFAVLGAFADYENAGDDVASIVAGGQKYPSKPVLYMMGEAEDVFQWLPAVAAGDDKVYDTIRQLTARNGADVPSQSNRQYLVDLTSDVRAAAPANRVESLIFHPVLPNSAEVVMTVYGGDHSWPPRDADDSGLRATEWVVEFFQRHQNHIPEEKNVLFDQGWTVPTLMAPVLF